MVNYLSVCLDLICFQLINKQHHSYFTAQVSVLFFTYFSGCNISEKVTANSAFIIIFYFPQLHRTTQSSLQYTAMTM